MKVRLQKRVKMYSLVLQGIQNNTQTVKTFYEKNKHSALGDAETLCRLSNSKAMHDRLEAGWVICFNSLIGPAKERIMQKRSQSVQRHYYPG